MKTDSRRRYPLSLTTSTLLLVISIMVPTTPAQASDEIDIKYFIALVKGTLNEQLSAIETIDRKWNKKYSANYVTMILEAMTFVRSRQLSNTLNKLIKKKTKQNIDFDINAWFEWVWSQDYTPHPRYAHFKSNIYRLADPIFEKYFNEQLPSAIRLDEVRWGGVRQDGIPPLRNPKMLNVSDARYLSDTDIIFGIEINGDLRAYPKRILAWHEMFIDEVGGEAIAGIYCTLCGTVIIYDTTVGKTNYKIGTSGFLYRSNKLMYDKATQSLWSTFGGSPVVGPLVGKNIKLPHRYVVTTTWGEWKSRHPTSKVLSLDTGYKRDYGEGVAYKSYFATDNLMFSVPKLDTRLKNKDEILGVVFSRYPGKPLAISVRYLADNPIFHGAVEKQTFVAFTDKSGAIRLYENKGIIFTGWDKNINITDETGKKWTMSESKLVSRKGDILFRLPANRAFWFGWYSAYTHTKLIR